MAFHLSSQTMKGKTVDLLPLFQKLVDTRELDPLLYEAAVSVARLCLAGGECKDVRAKEAKCAELATGFLVGYVYPERKRDIQTPGALKREMMRYLTRSGDPEGHELWELISEALHALAAEGKARRLDADQEEPNHNQAVWTSAEPAFDGKYLDLGDFKAKVKSVGTFYPAKRKAGDAAVIPKDKKERTPRIIPPSQAKKLVAQLLKVAEGPIMLEQLFREARRHVVLIGPYEPLDDQKQATIAERKYPLELDSDLKEWIELEYSRRADRIWRKILECNYGELMCLYYLPKHFLKKDVIMESFGVPQRVTERGVEISRILGKEMAVDKLAEERTGQAEAALRSAWLALTTKIVARLMAKCSEKGWDKNF